jgi:raffinose/stachyose/melibiose transport system substrate-binding protein
MDRVSRRRFLALGGAGAAALVTASCTPGSPAREAKAPPKPARTGVTEKGPVTLTVWDQESGQVSRTWNDLIKGFEQKYPNVTVRRVERSFGDLKALLKLALSGPHAPDVVEANQGWPDMGEMVKAGLLLPLDNYASAYGWFDRVPPTINAANSWTSDGQRFGTGKLFGFTNEGELVGVFYNKQILRKLGLSLPATFTEFENSLAAARRAGEIPIQFGDLDGWPGIHEWAAIQERYAPAGYMTDFIFGLDYDRVSFTTSQNLRAASTLQDWTRKGYFTPDLLAVGYDDSVSHFVKGQGLYMITGNWIVANLGPDNPEFGFMAMPPTSSGGPLVSTGGPGFPLSIASSSPHPDVAAAFIDWMTSNHAAQMLVQSGEIALNKKFTPTGVKPGTVLSEVLATAARLRDTDAIVPYEDWSTPSFYNTLTQSFQELLGSKDTPGQFLAKCEVDYSAFQKSRSAASAQPSPSG